MKWISRTSILFAIALFLPGQHPAQAQRSRLLVEAVDVVGNRRLSAAEILSHVKTQPGEPFSEKQSKRDLQELLSLGVFDKLLTRVVIEPGVRGGVAVIFEVVELPLLLEVKFQGLRGIKESEVIEAFRTHDINLTKETVYDPIKVRRGRLLLLQLLASRGWPNAVITVREEIGGTYVSIEFSVSYKE